MNKNSLCKNFILCGTVGWCMEILFTAFDSLRRRKRKLNGHTSLWMFPIYGMASFLSPVCKKMQGTCIAVRGIVYMFLIFLIEFFSGSLLKRFHACPWDYSRARANIHGVVRLDYAAYWFGAGLFFEWLLLRSNLK